MHRSPAAGLWTPEVTGDELPEHAIDRTCSREPTCWQSFRARGSTQPQFRKSHPTKPNRLAESSAPGSRPVGVAEVFLLESRVVTKDASDRWSFPTGVRRMRLLPRRRLSCSSGSSSSSVSLPSASGPWGKESEFSSLGRSRLACVGNPQETRGATKRLNGPTRTHALERDRSLSG